MAKKKAVKKTVKKAKKTVMKHNHELSMQEKLKDKNWDPLAEINEITDEYEAGTPPRELESEFSCKCGLENQDVGIVQDPKKTKKKK